MSSSKLQAPSSTSPSPWWSQIRDEEDGFDYGGDDGGDPTREELDEWMKTGVPPPSLHFDGEFDATTASVPTELDLAILQQGLRLDALEQTSSAIRKQVRVMPPSIFFFFIFFILFVCVATPDDASPGALRSIARFPADCSLLSLPTRSVVRFPTNNPLRSPPSLRASRPLAHPTVTRLLA